MGPVSDEDVEYLFKIHFNSELSSIQPHLFFWSKLHVISSDAWIFCVVVCCVVILGVVENWANSLLTSTGDITVKTGTSGSSNDLNINAANITLTATTNITLKVGSNKIVISNSGINIEGMQVQIKASTTVNVEATATSTLKGAVVNVEASGMTVIKGGLVKIN